MKEKRKPICIRLKTDTLRKLDELCEKTDRSRSSLINCILENSLRSIPKDIENN